jgi:hypothetical protein
MSILDILTQLQNSYGKPTMMTLYQNNVTFRAAMAPTDIPEMLFYRIEQCQEIQRIGKLSYSDDQIIANMVRILIQLNIFPLKEFDTWEATAQKTYPALKTFMHEAYGCRLTAMALRSTSGQNGYSNQTMYNVFAEEHENESDNDTVTTITQTAALTARFCPDPSWHLEGFDLVGKVGVGGGVEGVGGNQLLKDSCIIGSGAGKIVEGVVSGVKAAGGLIGTGWVGMA